jgi:hypothetical protein
MRITEICLYKIPIFIETDEDFTKLTNLLLKFICRTGAVFWTHLKNKLLMEVSKFSSVISALMKFNNILGVIFLNTIQDRLKSGH